MFNFSYLFLFLFSIECQDNMTDFFSSVLSFLLICFLFFHQHSSSQNILIPKLTASSLLSNNLGTCYIYDVYINRRTEVTFLDFGVNHALSTDSKMFTWHEIHTWNNSTQVEDGDDIGIDVRFVESMKEAVPSQLSQHRVPADFVGDPNKFLEEFVDAQRRGDFD